MGVHLFFLSQGLGKRVLLLERGSRGWGMVYGPTGRFVSQCSVLFGAGLFFFFLFFFPVLTLLLFYATKEAVFSLRLIRDRSRDSILLFNIFVKVDRSSILRNILRNFRSPMFVDESLNIKRGCIFFVSIFSFSSFLTKETKVSRIFDRSFPFDKVIRFFFEIVTVERHLPAFIVF